MPWLERLDLQGFVRRMKKMSRRFDRFLEHVLDVHNERRQLEGDRVVARDMVDVLLQRADDPNLEVPMSRDNVKALVQVILLISLFPFRSCLVRESFWIFGTVALPLLFGN